MGAKTAGAEIKVGREAGAGGAEAVDAEAVGAETVGAEVKFASVACCCCCSGLSAFGTLKNTKNVAWPTVLTRAIP